MCFPPPMGGLTSEQILFVGEWNFGAAVWGHLGADPSAFTRASLRLHGVGRVCVLGRTRVSLPREAASASSQERVDTEHPGRCCLHFRRPARPRCCHPGRRVSGGLSLGDSDSFSCHDAVWPAPGEAANTFILIRSRVRPAQEGGPGVARRISAV